MKLKKYVSGLIVAFALSAVALSTGCESDPEKFGTALNDTLISADGGVAVLKVFTPGEFNWAIVRPMDGDFTLELPWWLSVDPMSGSGDVTVHFTALPNPCIWEREEQFIITCGNEKHTYRIRQAGSPDFGFNNDIVYFHTSSELGVTGSYSWTLESKPTWLTVDPTSGSAPGEESWDYIEFSAPAYPAERSGYAVFKDQNGKLYTIRVVQLASMLL